MNNMRTKKNSGRLALKLIIPLVAVMLFLVLSIIATFIQVNSVRKGIRELQSKKVVVMELAQNIRYYVLNTSEIFTDMSAVKDLEGVAEAREIKEEFINWLRS